MVLTHLYSCSADRLSMPLKQQKSYLRAKIIEGIIRRSNSFDSARSEPATGFTAWFAILPFEGDHVVFGALTLCQPLMHEGVI